MPPLPRLPRAESWGVPKAPPGRHSGSKGPLPVLCGPPHVAGCALLRRKKATIAHSNSPADRTATTVLAGNAGWRQ